jgi:rhodanese-related sulfurtransferase
MAWRQPVDEVRRRLDAGEPILFVDSRRPDAWEDSSEKLPGAVRVLPDVVDENAGQLAKGRPLVVYCTCPNEKSSSKTAQRLEELGFQDVAVLVGGMDAWIEAGEPIEHKFASMEEATVVPQ